MTPDRPSPPDDGWVARLAAGSLLYVWSAALPFFPTDRLIDPAYYSMIMARPAAILGLALWAMVDHIRAGRRLQAFALTPALTIVHFIATGVVAMVFSFLASGQTPL